jgi:uncharacterized membrane protein
MSIEKYVIVAIVLLCVAQGAYALTFYGSESHIEDEKLFDSVRITLNENNSQQLKILYMNKIINFSFSANFPANCELSPSERGTFVICDVSKATPKNRSIAFNLTLQSVQKVGDKYNFKKEFVVYESVNSFFMSVYLPKLSQLNSDSIIPTYGAITSDGRSIIVYWQKNSIPLGELLSFQMSYEVIGGQQDYTVSIISAVILIIVVFVAALAVKYKKLPEIRTIFPVLKSDEKMIMELILKHGDGVNQKVIVRESGLSKAKVSKVLKSLSERDIVRLERVGRSNRIYLVKYLKGK